MRFDRGRTILFLSCAAALVAFATPDNAQAQAREGFIVGLGVGAAYTHFSAEGADAEGKAGVAVEIKLGGMLNSSTALYFGTTGNLHSAAGLDGDILWSTSVGGVGAMFFLDDAAPVSYVDVVVGVSARGCYEDYCKFQSGFGAGVGTGIMLSETTSIDFEILYGRPAKGLTALTFKGSFSWLSK